jgi:tRNA threonylcarbamoyladenosine biosynthesis protein TsaB
LRIATGVVLGIDTATAVAAVGVARRGSVAADVAEWARGGAAARLVDLVDRALVEAGAGRDDVEAVAVSIGPGSFTGLRVGLGFAKGLAYAGGKPLVAVPTLEALAAAAPGDAERVAVSLDARKHEVYFAVYARGGTGLEERIEPGAASPGEAARRIVDALEGGGVLVGDAAETHPEEFADLGRIRGVRVIPFAEVHPRGAVVAALGWRRLGAGDEAPIAAVEPAYVRAPEAVVRFGGAR